VSTLTKREKINEREHSRDRLTALLNTGDTIYTVIRSVSASGMSRTMSLYVVKENRLINITYYVANLLEWRLVDVNGSRVMRVGGCGMDMGFHAVYTLSRVLFTSIDNSLINGDKGYSLKQEWI